MTWSRRISTVLAAMAAALLGAVGAAAQSAAPTAEEGWLPVPAVTIYAGDTITDAMIEERQFPPAVLDRMAVIEGRGPLIGKIARRMLIAGKPIPVNAVTEPMLVTRGVPTQVVFRSGGVVITALAFPMRSGAMGDYIQMRNMDSGQIIAGIVQGDGTVLLGGAP